VQTSIISLGPRAGGGSRWRRSKRARSSRPAVVERYSRRVDRSGGGFEGRSGRGAVCWGVGAGRFWRYHGRVEGVDEGVADSSMGSVSIGEVVVEKALAFSVRPDCVASAADVCSSFRSLLVVLIVRGKVVGGVQEARRDDRATCGEDERAMDAMQLLQLERIAKAPESGMTKSQ
jgi:hypothetical protein